MGQDQIEFGRQERQDPTEESQFSSRFGTSRINAKFLFKFAWIVQNADVLINLSVKRTNKILFD
jgi:hypothetical protein